MTCLHSTLFLLYTLSVVSTSRPRSCPADIEERISSTIKAEIERLNFTAFAPVLYPDRPCGCGGSGWTKVVSLNMSDPTQQCPGDWIEHTSPVRGCEHITTGCVSAVFETGRTYFQVCGRINAYQYGVTEAFYWFNKNPDAYSLEQNYFSGVSLTHGAPGSRQHIWSFVAALFEASSTTWRRQQNCACSDTTTDWPYI